MTADEIREALALAKRATPGPWSYEYPAPHYQHILAVGPGNPVAGRAIANTWFDPDSDREGRVEDADFIAAARTLVPALANELAKARAVLRAVLDMANYRLEEPEEEEWQELARLAEDLLA